MNHSILAPSSANMWAKCGGWVVMSQSFPVESDSTEAAKIGTAAHEVAARYIDSYARAKTYNPMAGEVASNGIIIDDEMLDAAEMYADNVRAVMVETKVFGGPFLGVESRLEMPDINPHVFGTPDCFLIDTANRTAYIWDYKHGFDPVEVFENLQLITYSSGVLNYLLKHTPFILESNSDFKFVFRIVQPRAMHRDGPIREWAITLDKLRPFYEQLRQAAEIAMSGTGLTQSGPHCKYCPARHACQSALTATVRIYEVASQALPLDMTPQALATQLTIINRAYAQIKSMKDALEQQVESLVKSGKSVNGFIAAPTYGRERWSKPLDEVFLMGDLCGIDLRKPTAITPKQAQKLGIDASVIMQYIDKPMTGIKIVPDDGSKARLVFGDNN